MPEIQTSKFVVLKVPISAHVKKFITYNYGDEFVLSHKNHIGLLLYQILRKRQFRSDSAYKEIADYTDTWNVLISDWYAFDKGCIMMNNYQVHMINSYFESIIMENCHVHLYALEMNGGKKRKKYIYEWLDRHDINTGSKDWYQKISKSYNRYRKKIAKNTNKSPCRVSTKKSTVNHTFSPCHSPT